MLTSVQVRRSERRVPVVPVVCPPPELNHMIDPKTPNRLG